MTEKNNMSVQIDSMPDVRRGVYSDVVVINTKDGMSRLDFLYIDIAPNDAGDGAGVLAARIHMTNADLLSLRDTLIQHTSQWGELGIPTHE